MSHHLKRVEDQVRRVLSEAIGRRLRDPRLGIVSVTSVSLSPDLRHGRVYLAIVGDEAEVETSLDVVRSATGLLRSEIGKAMRLRFVPELQFFHDETVTAQARIEELLRDADGSGDDEPRRKETEE